MYSGISNTENYLARTGSYSLRFRKSGDNSDLAGLVVDVSYTADKAGDVSRMVDDLTNEINIRKDRIRPLQKKLEKINIKMQQTLPFNIFDPLKKEKLNLNASIQENSLQIEALRKKRKELAPAGNIRNTLFGDAFVSIAQQVLPSEVYKQIRESALDALHKAHGQTE